ncbi:Hypothetical protein SRAE_X000100600 [Strongyloides ratti]|uniref:Uncharacterized protein n=1 Tax=Strongyloides ratti TaxID=34506 RepID=A0A090KTT9_STRRB|nr:Hypothetical protein SRAE_X000100600 [Strongyloides ratti]CEF59255.1 Hypothetical protein SRAE_X000100600 [Strongyloides ratti]
MKITLILISVYAIIILNLTSTINSFAFGQSTNTNNNGRLFALSEDGSEYLKKIKRSPRLFATNLNDFAVIDFKYHPKFAKHHGTINENAYTKKFAFAKRSNLENDAFALDYDDVYNGMGIDKFAYHPFAKRKPFAKREVKGFAFA